MIKKLSLLFVLIVAITTTRALAQNQAIANYVHSATQKINGGDSTGALSDVDKAIQIDAHNTSPYLTKGYIYIRMKQFQKAVDVFTYALSIDPRSVNAYLNRGAAYAQLHQVPEAAADFDQAVELVPDSGFCYFFRGQFEYNLRRYRPALADLDLAILHRTGQAYYYELRGQISIALTDTTAAIQDYKTALRLNPNSTSAQQLLNSASKNPNAFKITAPDYDLAIQKNPNSVEPYYDRGMARLRQKQYNDAMADFDRSLTIDNNYIQGYLGKARVYLALNNKVKALEVTKTASKLKTNNLLQNYMRGSLERDMNMNTEALADLTRVIQGTANGKIEISQSQNGYTNTKTFSGYDAAAYNSRGALLEKMHQYSEAMSDFTHAIALQPKNIDNYTGRSFCELQLHLYAQALADNNTEVQIAPENTVSYTNRSNTELCLGMYVEAWADENKALKYWPDNEYSYMHLGTIAYWSGDYFKALDYYNKMIDHSHKILSEKYTYRGMVERRLEKFDEAAADLNKTIDEDPTNYYPHLELGELNIEIRNYSDAVTELRKAINLNNTATRAYNSLGYTYFRMGEYQKAIAYYDSAMVKGKKDNYQPYFEFRDEAVAANPNKPFTHLTWICPVEDVNKIGAATLRPSSNLIEVRIKVSSATPIVKQNIKVLLNGSPLPAERLTVTDTGQSRLNTNNGDYEYEYKAQFVVGGVNSTVAVSYDNKSSQQLTIRYAPGEKVL